jgi:type VI secretion system secreted protein Hcp
MAIPVYLWLKDDGGADIKGSVDVQDREGSIEVVAQEHNLYIPTDNNTGKLTGTRIHTPFLFTKEIDSSSPYLYKAVTTGQTLKSAEFKWYKINDAGQEVEYFNTRLENVKVVKVNPVMHDIKDPLSRSTTTLSRLNCVTKKSPGPTKTATSFIPIPGTNAPPPRHISRVGCGSCCSRVPPCYCTYLLTDTVRLLASAGVEQRTHNLPADRMRFGPLHGKQRGAVACPGTDKERDSWKIQPSCCDV